MSDMIDYSQCFEEMFNEEPDSPAMVDHIDAVTRLVAEYNGLKVVNKLLKEEIVKLKQELLEKSKHNSKM